MTPGRRNYSLAEEGDTLTFRAVLFQRGGGSALNNLVYNRELAAIMIAGGAAMLVYLALFHAGTRGVFAWLIPAALFVPLFMAARFWLLKDKTLCLVIDRSGGLIEIERDRLTGTSKRTLEISDVRLVEVEEIEAPDESDVGEIIRWHRLAEPGVHSTPLPVFKLHLVLKGEEKILIFTDCVLEGAIEVRRRLAGFLNIFPDGTRARVQSGLEGHCDHPSPGLKDNAGGTIEDNGA